MNIEAILKESLTQSLNNNWSIVLCPGDIIPSINNDIEKKYDQVLKELQESTEDKNGDYVLKRIDLLNNLANFQRNVFCLVKDLSKYNLIQIIKEDNYSEELNFTLEKFKDMQRQIGSYNQAEQNYIEAIKLFKELPKDISKKHLAYLAVLLANYAVLLSKLNSDSVGKANKSFQAALKLSQQLYTNNPDAFQSIYASILFNHAIFQRDVEITNEIEEQKSERVHNADNAFSQLIALLHNLANEDPETYKPRLAYALVEYAKLKRNDVFAGQTVRQLYNNALTIFEQLEEQCPGRYIEDIEEVKALL